MSRLATPELTDIDAKTQGTLDAITKQFGFTPGMFTALAANPAVLEIVMGLQGSIAKLLDAKTRHTIALATSHANDCDYCSALHGYISANLGGMSAEEIELARKGGSTDPKRAAVANFSQQVIETRGQVGDEDIAAVREAGYTDPEIQAIVTVVVVTLLTNFLNNVNDTTVDIPGAGRGTSDVVTEPAVTGSPR
ncbi:carboxymuconolactone decarboxylase family protein [Amycolatopsis sp. NPDC051903]|uniref:carboxymuconolactone decarboxylase family protein n=1 Tax=Amycolatopsis sp. NPDC051903 TaxID=3363936 RepID=UPI0037987236